MTTTSRPWAHEPGTVSGKRLVVVGGTLSVAVLFGISFAFRSLGLNRFVANANLQEGKSNVVYLARSVEACAVKTGKLPPSSGKVPRDLATVGGKTYASTPADWSDEAFSCMGFAVHTPQRFQYEWERRSDTLGVARARGDFNGDGVAEATFEQDLLCTPRGGTLRCAAGVLHDKN